MVVVEKDIPHERIAAVDSGVWDYVTKPFQNEELIARIKRSIKGIQYALAANPLTGLPGNIAIHEKLEELISQSDKFAVAYLDIDNFKSFNDLYGYTAGDHLLSRAAWLILECQEEFPSVKDKIFIGHLGGDDYIFICPQNIVGKFCKKYISKFDTMVPSQYDEETALRGFVLGRDRKGNATTFPLVSISIAVVANTNGKLFKHVGEVAQAAAEVKSFLKKVPGSGYMINRRKEFQKTLLRTS